MKNVKVKQAGTIRKYFFLIKNNMPQYIIFADRSGRGCVTLRLNLSGGYSVFKMRSGFDRTFNDYNTGRTLLRSTQLGTYRIPLELEAALWKAEINDDNTFYYKGEVPKYEGN